MCLWDAQFGQNVIAAPKSVALTTNWTRTLEPNPLRVGLLLTPDVTNTSFWWPDERSGATGTGIIVPTTPGFAPQFYWGKDGRMPANVWFARIAVANATVFIVEYLIPQWLYNQIGRDTELRKNQWQEQSNGT